MKFEADLFPLKKILWNKGYTEYQEYELVTYQTVMLECGHQAKVRKISYKLIETACLICEE